MENLAITVITIFITALTTAAFGYWGIFRQVQANLQEEYERKFNDKKWELYVGYTDAINKMLKFAKEKGTRRNKGLSEATGIMQDFAAGLLLVGSDDVVKAFNKFRGASQIAEQPDLSKAHIDLLVNAMSVIIIMRQDLGYVSTEITPKDLLRVFINDIDEIMDRLEYPD